MFSRERQSLRGIIMNTKETVLTDLVAKIAQLNEALPESVNEESIVNACSELSMFIHKVEAGGLGDEVPELLLVAKKISALANETLELYCLQKLEKNLGGEA
jgi:hypothetical protein